MDGNVFGFEIAPDQMQVVNPAMVLILIPIFDKLIHPCFARHNLMENPLHRMAVGGLFASAAFIAAGTLELILERTYPKEPDLRHASLYIVNTLQCDIRVENPFNHIQNISSGAIYKFSDVACLNYTKYTIVVASAMDCGRIYVGRGRHKLQAVAFEHQTDMVLIGINSANQIQSYVTDSVDFQKSLSGKPRLRMNYIKGTNRLKNVTVSLKSQTGLQDIYFVQVTHESTVADSAYMELPQGLYDCQISSTEEAHLLEETFHLAFGGVYSLVIRERNLKIEFFKLYVMSSPNKVNVLWLLPQYFLISVAEILFGVSGLEFSFSQAPKSMKTITIAGWYLSVAFGNFLVILITQANLFKSQAMEFFLFSVFMVADMIIFVVMASKYKFVQLEADSSACCCVQHPEEEELFKSSMEN